MGSTIYNKNHGCDEKIAGHYHLRNYLYSVNHFPNGSGFGRGPQG